MSTTEKLKKNNIKIKAFEVNCIKLYKNAEKETITTKRNKIKVQPWTTVKELKTIISNINKVHSKNIRLFFEKFELINDLSMNDYHILEKKHPKISYEIIDNDNNKENPNFEIKVYGTFPCCDSLKKIIRKISYAFALGLNPVIVEDGTSGTYKLRNPEKEIVGIFKPFDEEPFAPNNNKNNVGKFGSETFRKGILSGEGTIREVAAYILDKKDKNMENIFDVPPTTFVEISHPFFNKNNEEMLYIDEDIDNILKNGLILQFLNEKISSKKNNINVENKQPYLSTKKYNYITRKYGSLQKFIESTGVVADYSYSLFTIEEAHKIMILDFRILNCDRNDENILLIKEGKIKNTKKDFYKLIPIDHALSFPSCLKIGDYEMCWMTWSQAEQPFTKKEKEYIENINIISDMQHLNEYINLREDCWKFFRISNTILKIGAKYNLTPFEIGSLMYTLDYDKKEPSKIELIIQKTDNLCSCLKVDKRLRLFSAGSKEEKERQNKFTKINCKRTSLLEKTTSEPKKKANEDSENSSNDEYFGLKSNGKKRKKNGKSKKEKSHLSRTSSISQEIVFDSPYNELYFSHFVVFLKELIKNEYPEKAKIYEENLEIEEEKNLKNYEYNLNIIETNKDFFGEQVEGLF